MVAQRNEHPAVRLLRTLGDPVRFRLLRELPAEDASEISVGSIARRLGVTDAVASQHLRVLSGLGLVGVKRSGRNASYYVKPEALQAARQSLAGAWPSFFAAQSGEPQLSARNQLVGKVVEMKLGEVEAEVAIDIGGQVVVGVITRASVERLGLHEGDVATAVIKGTDVMFIK